MNDDAVPSWVAQKKLVLYMPVAKFFMGCTAYLGSVILISWRDLQDSSEFQIACLGIGIMSMSSGVRRAREPGTGFCTMLRVLIPRPFDLSSASVHDALPHLWAAKEANSKANPRRAAQPESAIERKTCTPIGCDRS